MKRPSRTRLFFIAGAIAAAAAAVAISALSIATSEEPSGVVDFTKLTPVGYQGSPPPRPNYPPDFDKVPTCQAPADEKPSPDLPPLSCRYSGSEPTPGAIKTASPEEKPEGDGATTAIPDGWTLVDNGLFHYTIAIPPGWYSNMRPEGGEFHLFDPVAIEQERTGKNLLGGIIAQFSARAAVEQELGNTRPLPVDESHALESNAKFGSVPGAIWTEEDEGLAETIRAAFIKDHVTFAVRFNVGAGNALELLAKDRATVQAILSTLTPY